MFVFCFKVKERREGKKGILCWIRIILTNVIYNGN